MSKPSEFTLSSDFASLANDGTGDASVMFPGSQSVAVGGTLKSYSATINIGSVGSSTRWRMCSSKDSNTWFVGATLEYKRSGIVSGVPGFIYSIFSTVTKTNPTTVTVIVMVHNPYGSVLTTEAGDETFQFHVNTFIPPFV